MIIPIMKVAAPITPLRKICFLTSFFLIASLLISCEKEVQVDLPEIEQALVVEGRIESDTIPYIMLTKSMGYFEATDINSFLNSFVHGAKISVTVDNTTYPLPEFCLNDLPPQIQSQISESFGIPPGINYCIYTVPVADLISGNYLKGKIGKTYHLTIESEGKTYTSSTKIPSPVPLDSVWFQLDGQDTLFGFAWAHLTDPDTPDNAYRWSAKRINTGTSGKPKDENFVYPFGSAFDDKFINGKSFDFGYDRGHRPSDEAIKEDGEKQHFYKSGDTIIVKFCSIEKPVMEFIRKYETEIWNSGNPFASPSTIPTNISGGALGLWAGYAVSYDTIYAVK